MCFDQGDTFAREVLDSQLHHRGYLGGEAFHSLCDECHQAVLVLLVVVLEKGTVLLAVSLVVSL